MAKAIAHQLNLVLKTSGIRIARHLKTLLPTAQIVGVYAVAAAFAGAVWGKHSQSVSFGRQYNRGDGISN